MLSRTPLFVASSFALLFAAESALGVDGTLRAWGRDDEGQITVPADLGRVLDVSGGSAFTIALKRDEHHAMMRQSHPEWADRIEYWTVHDIDFLEPAHALPQIEARVLELVREFGGPA